MVVGISHITFRVTDLNKMSHFLTFIFDAKEIYASGEEQFSLSEEKFFLVGGVWICIMEGPALAERSYNHVAFQVPEVDFDKYAQRVEALGVEIHPGRARLPEEGRSIYFYDYDNHLFEIHAGSLSERLNRYAKGVMG